MIRATLVTSKDWRIIVRHVDVRYQAVVVDNVVRIQGPIKEATGVALAGFLEYTAQELAAVVMHKADWKEMRDSHLAGEQIVENADGSGYAFNAVRTSLRQWVSRAVTQDKQ